jgi:hypothetical protein
MRPPCEAKPLEFCEGDGALLTSMPPNLSKFESDLRTTISNSTLKTQEQHLRSSCLNLSVAQGLLDALLETTLDCTGTSNENPTPSLKEINPELLKQHLRFLGIALKEASISTTNALANTVFQRRDTILAPASKPSSDRKATLLNSSIEVMSKELRRHPLESSSFFSIDQVRIAKRKADDAQNAMIFTAKSLTQEMKSRGRTPSKKAKNNHQKPPKRLQGETQPPRFEQRQQYHKKRDADRHGSSNNRPVNSSPASASSYSKRGGHNRRS